MGTWSDLNRTLESAGDQSPDDIDPPAGSVWGQTAQSPVAFLRDLGPD
jgi:hypothetical protein